MEAIYPDALFLVMIVLFTIILPKSSICSVDIAQQAVIFMGTISTLVQVIVRQQQV